MVALSHFRVRPVRPSWSVLDRSIFRSSGRRRALSDPGVALDVSDQLCAKSLPPYATAVVVHVHFCQRWPRPGRGGSGADAELPVGVGLTHWADVPGATDVIGGDQELVNFRSAGPVDVSLDNLPTRSPVPRFHPRQPVFVINHCRYRMQHLNSGCEVMRPVQPSRLATLGEPTDDGVGSLPASSSATSARGMTRT